MNICDHLFSDISTANKYSLTSFVQQDKTMILFLIFTLTFTTGVHGGPVPTSSDSLSNTPKIPAVCPLQKVKENFDMSKVDKIIIFLYQS